MPVSHDWTVLIAWCVGTPDGCDELLGTVLATAMTIDEAWELLRSCSSKGAFERRLATLRSTASGTGSAARLETGDRPAGATDGGRVLEP